MEEGMIKLKTLIPEAMQRINMVDQNLNPEPEMDRFLDIATKMAKALKGTKLIYRGFNPSGRGIGSIYKVTNDRTGFLGNMNQNAVDVTNGLKDKFNFKAPSPVFTSFSKDKASFFWTSVYIYTYFSIHSSTK